MKQHVVIPAVLWLSLLAILVPAPGALAGNTIRLGFVADATGVGESWYKSQKAGIDFFIEETNAQGGILGKKLELVVRDSALNPDRGAAMAEELILKENCDFLMGPTSSGVALQVTKVARKFGKIVVFHTSNAEQLTTTDFQPYMLQVVPNTGIEARGFAQYFTLKPFKRFCYLGPDYEYARDWWANFKTYLTAKKPDVQIVSEDWTKLGDTNFASSIAQMSTKDPEIIVTNLWGESLVKFIRQAKRSGLLARARVCSLFDLETLKSIGLDMPEGLLGYSRCPFYGSRKGVMKQFAARYYERYQDWPSDWAVMAYDGLLALAEAIRKAESLDSDKIVQAMEGMPWKSLRGSHYIRREDHMADVGVYVGYTTKDPRFEKFLILKDLTVVPAEQVWMSVDDLKKVQPRRQ